MTATDELRRLLDERGVEWRTFKGVEELLTDVPSLSCVVEPLDGDSTVRVIRYFDTPEQAIEATLGRGECHIEQGHTCSECRAVIREQPYETFRKVGTANWVFDGHEAKFCPNCGRRVMDA